MNNTSVNNTMAMQGTSTMQGTSAGNSMNTNNMQGTSAGPAGVAGPALATQSKVRRTGIVVTKTPKDEDQAILTREEQILQIVPVRFFLDTLVIVCFLHIVI